LLATRFLGILTDYRCWVAERGGVYVRVSEGCPPNPYLSVPDRDVTTTSGVPLTLINPACMARQANTLAGATGGSRGAFDEP
jgi:hypothetical protein